MTIVVTDRFSHPKAFFALLFFGLVIISSLFFSGCRKVPENIITRNDFDSLVLSPFVEPDFPFITTSLDLRDLGSDFPSGNIVSRGIVMMLGDSAYACFDTDLLRWSVAWFGDFISLTGMAQISYDDFFNKRNEFPRVLGTPAVATGLYPGWEAGDPTWSDPRSKNAVDHRLAWGPIPAESGRYEGLFLQSGSSVLHYTVFGTDIYESGTAEDFEGNTVFVRSLQLAPHPEKLYLHLSEVSDGTDSYLDSDMAVIFQGDDRENITAISFVGNGSGLSLEVAENKYIDAVFSSDSEMSDVSILIWKGKAAQLENFRKWRSAYKHTPIEIETKNIQRRWPEKVFTTEEKSPDTAALVLDRLLLPVPNPWKRNVRVMDMDFTEDGTAMVVTYEGDIWRIEGINADYMTWTRFASGLNEPMSIRILRDTVYVFDRLGITRFHDRNGDGEADYYENFSNVVPQSMETREWAASLEIDPKGGFYIAKGGALSNGPAIGDPTLKGFRTGSEWDGSVIWISPDGRQAKIIATGLRGPFLGINPQTGMLTASDQQGNFVPSTPVIRIQEGDYYGVPPTSQGFDTSHIAPPLLWIPHHVDQSGLGEMWITSDRMGPLNDQFIHISFGRPGLFKIMIDDAREPWQGGATLIKGDYLTPTSKGRTNPKDGMPYFTGFNLWGSQSRGISSIIRLRYVEGRVFGLPLNFRAGREGVVLEFTEALDPEYIQNIGLYQVKRYNYLRTPEYGSGHYKLDGTEGEEQLPVIAAYLSHDGKKLFLNVPNMEPVEQMELKYDLKTVKGDTLRDEFWFTLHEARPIDLHGLGFESLRSEDLVLQEDLSELEEDTHQEVSVSRGEDLFRSRACAGCHSPGTVRKGFYGPPFQDLYGSVQEFEEGEPLLADADYIRESILEPDKRIVKGYASEMPSYRGILNGAEIESLILYIESLSSKK